MRDADWELVPEGPEGEGGGKTYTSRDGGGGGMAGGNSPQGPQQQFHNVDEKFKFETPVRQESLE